MRNRSQQKKNLYTGTKNCGALGEGVVIWASRGDSEPPEVTHERDHHACDSRADVKAPLELSHI